MKQVFIAAQASGTRGVARAGGRCKYAPPMVGLVAGRGYQFGHHGYVMAVVGVAVARWQGHLLPRTPVNPIIFNAIHGNHCHNPNIIQRISYRVRSLQVIATAKYRSPSRRARSGWLGTRRHRPLE